MFDEMFPEQRDEVVDLLCYERAYYHQEDYDRPYPERHAEMLAQLEEDQKGEPRLSPDALVFSNIGEVQLVRMVNTDSLFTFTYANSNPEVVSVYTREDGRFELEALSPGEATLTVRCILRDGSELNLTCSMRCDW